MFIKTKLEELKLIKKNYQDKGILVTGGLLIIIISLICWSIMLALGHIERELFDIYLFFSLIIGVTGFLDDLEGDGNARGLRGHFDHLKKGILTTGIIKVFVISISAFLLALKLNESLWEVLIDTGIIVFMTNLLNLLDLRPGRSIKFFILISVLMINRGSFLYYLPYFIAFLFYLPFEMKEKMMLGDCGANLLGFILAFNIVLKSENYILLLSFFILALILNILSESRSFSSIIKNNPVLNWIDSLGRDL